MDIILYAMPDSITGQVLEKLLGKKSPELVLNRFSTLQRFIQHIIEHRVNEHIIIAIIERPKEFIALHSLFENNDASNLIIVCNDTKEMIELAHELRPRFLAHGNETLKVIAVVEKMLQSNKIANGERL
jgi:superfamily II DNA/RNA helicase